MAKEGTYPVTDAVEKVAILGGGPAALAAAFELSHPDQNGRYEVTLYQVGWRLGGKCASGRKMDAGCRIQEHGPHLFFGFYDNAFAVLRACYEELRRGRGEGFKTIEDALEARSGFYVMEEINGEWKPWHLSFPVMPGTPGTQHYPSEWQIIYRVLVWLKDLVELSAEKWLEAHLGFGAAPATANIAAGTSEASHTRSARIAADTDVARHAATQAAEIAARVPHQEHKHNKRHYSEIVEQVDRLRSWFRNLLHDEHYIVDELRRLFILVDLGAAIVIGALEDGLIFPTQEELDQVNLMDLREWLVAHGAHQWVADSALVRGQYDTVFAYPDGDVSKPGNIEAGTAVRAQLSMAGYRGPIVWKMRAGTGDVVATPVYEVLRKRGVRIEFFHRVDALEPTADGSAVARIRIGRQVRLKSDTYEPLVQCGELACWPSEPLYDQIVEGDKLKAEGVNLESYWTDWKDTGGELVLEQGRDFDHVVLGISVEAVKAICAPLSGHHKAWDEMLVNSWTVQTQCVQLWSSLSLRAMGWPDAAENDEGDDSRANPVVTGYDVTALDTWLDASEVLPQECWPDGTVKQMSMLCGPMPTALAVPPKGMKDFPRQSFEMTLSLGARFLETHAASFWPHLGSGDAFNWNAFVAPDDVTGPARLREQYIRANVDPSDRYVMTPVNTSKYRLKTHETGFDNLLIVGDWINNGMNLGSFEAAISSGRQASQALSGLPKMIFRFPRDRSSPPPTTL